MSDELNIPTSNSSESQASFDDPWKEGLELHFEPFLADGPTRSFRAGIPGRVETVPGGVVVFRKG
ncbi:hypothetical protein NDA01_29575 [Trichocoleus desertorum AS-A10]|uniref:hypothetical protein n=1 Tax=Trichocoleus desertorum TaxID=1481672 RepID=UPI0032987510